MSNAPKAIDSALAHNATIGGSRVVSYRDMQVLVPLRDVRDAMKSLRDGDRPAIMRSVNAAIARVFPRVQKGTASQKEAMDCAQDIAIWFANEVIEGRATLEVH